MAMSKANKAALLSAFAFPGAGYFVVKQKARGLLIVVAALMNLSVIGSVLSATIEYRFNQMMTGLNSLSGNDRIDLTASLPSGDAQAVSFASIILLLMWLLSTCDCYRRGRLLDQIDEIRRIKQVEAEAQPQ